MEPPFCAIFITRKPRRRMLNFSPVAANAQCCAFIILRRMYKVKYGVGPCDKGWGSYDERGNTGVTRRMAHSLVDHAIQNRTSFDDPDLGRHATTLEDQLCFFLRNYAKL